MKTVIASRLTQALGILAIGALAGTASAQIQIVTTTTAFNDISTTGTSPGTAADDSEHNVTMAALSAAGFAGNELLPLKDIRIGNNGAVLWGATTGDVGWINSTTLATMAPAGVSGSLGNGGGLTPPAALLAPMWDDMRPLSGDGNNVLDWQVIGGNLIIQWTNQDHFNATGAGTVTFQAVVYGGATIASGAPLVDFVYNDTDYGVMQYQNDGGSATIGYKNWGTVAGANDVEFGMGGGNDTITDPAFGDPTMKPKVAGYVQAGDPTLPHAVRIQGVPPPPPPSKFCRGDGTGEPCPCGNSGASGRGCANASDANGAALDFAGTPSISGDTFALSSSGTPPTSPILFYQGTTRINSGLGTALGDGLTCVGGNIVRLGTKISSGGMAMYPGGGDATISVKGMCAAGDVRHYQGRYRDAATFCTADTFNSTNGVTATWTP